MMLPPFPHPGSPHRGPRPWARQRRTLTLAVSLAAVLLQPARAQEAPGTGASGPVPAQRAHAHNDYLHPRPLLDALEQGFCSVEADVWLVGGELRVGHTLEATQPGRTLQRLYLDPLRRIIRANGGRVYRDGPPLTLLVDVKSDATNSYRALLRVLRRYQSILTRFDADKTVTNALTVIVSGNRARDLMRRGPRRWAAYDGRLEDLEQADPPGMVPWISDNYAQHFKWRAGAEEGPFPEAERTKLQHLVQRTHAQGRLLRLWGMPDNPASWQVQAEAGVDVINTDDLKGLAAFLKARPKP